MTRDRPNVLLILADQHRGDCLGIDGHPVLSTPNLDQLAAEGGYFRRAYSECPSCVPARRTIMSGQSPEAHGMVGYRDGVLWDPPYTLAGELGRAGYQTEMIGKLHLWPARRRYGFDHMLRADSTFAPRRDNDYVEWLGESGATAMDAVEPGVAHGISANGWVGRPNHLPEHKTHSFWCVDQAIRFLSKRDPACPFFLNVSFIDPHPPLTPPAFYYDRYMALDLPEPVTGDWAPDVEARKGQDVNASRVRLDCETMRRCRAAYYGLINHVDDQIGRLLNWMRAYGLLRNTFVLYTADHGEMLGDHNMFRKTFAYEGSARIPFITWAGPDLGLPAGADVVEPVGLQDVLPTLLDVAGVPLPDGVTGRSVRSLLAGQAEGWRDALHGEHAGCYEYDDGVHFLVAGHTKYIWYSQTGQEHLFDLDADPQELHDLAREPDADVRLAPWHRSLVARLRPRPEGFIVGDHLVAGRPHDVLLPNKTLE